MHSASHSPSNRSRSRGLGRSRASGFTLVEMLVTITLIVIVLSQAAPSFATFQRNAELTSVANTLLSSLSSARSEAMKRGRNVFVVPADGTIWTSGWIVFVDTDGSMTLDESTDTVVSREAAAPTTISAVTGAAPEGFKDPNNSRIYVMFNGSGYPRLVSGAFQAASLDLSNGIDTRRIVSSPAGRLRVCKPAETGCTASSL